MSGWDISSFSKRAEYYIKSLQALSVTVDVPVAIRLETVLSTYITSCFDVCFVVNGKPINFFPLNLDILEFLVVMPELNPDEYTHVFVYYDRINYDFILPNTQPNLKFFVYKRSNTNYYWHPSNHMEMVEQTYNVNNVLSSYVQNDLYTSAYYGSYFCYYVSVWFYADEAGMWQFAVDCDDASEVEIGGVVVASWYGGHGTCNCTSHSGSIDLDVGWYCLIARHENGHGGVALRVYYKQPADSNWGTFSADSLRCFRVEHNQAYIKRNAYISDGYSDPSLVYLYDMLPNIDVVNTLSSASLKSTFGNDFISVGVATEQTICGHTAVRSDKSISSYCYVNCGTTDNFSIFVCVYIVAGGGLSRLITLNNNTYIRVDSDGSLIFVVDSVVYDLGYRVVFDVCSSISIVSDSSKVYIVYDGVVVFVEDVSISIDNIYLGGYELNKSSTSYFYNFIKCGYVGIVFMQYLHSSFCEEIVKLSGYDVNNIFLSMGYWPTPVLANEPCVLLVEGGGVTKYSVYDVTHAIYLVNDENYGINSQAVFNGAGDIHLRLIGGGIDKDYLLKVSVGVGEELYIPSEVDISYADKTGLSDFISFAFFGVPHIAGYINVPIEYTYVLDAFPIIIDIDTEYVQYGSIYPHVIDVDVEYIYDTEVTNCDIMFPTYVIAAEVTYVDILDFSCDLGFFGASNDKTDIPVWFSSANWKYFDYGSECVVSLVGLSDSFCNITTQSGTLSRYVCDTIVSDMGYLCNSADISVSLENLLHSFIDTETTSGCINRYSQEVTVSALDYVNTQFNVKLNTIVFDDFSINVGEVAVETNCYSVDVRDMYYDIDVTYIHVYYGATEITSITTSRIPNGYSVNWCFDLFTEPSVKFHVFLVKAKNLYGDTGIQSFYLRCGMRFRYNPYHITIHDYNTLIPVLILAENAIDIYPAIAGENFYVRTENMPYRGLSASITPVGNKKDILGASITTLTSNFYPGGHYTITVSCKDMAGNEMPEFSFSFRISEDGN